MVVVLVALTFIILVGWAVYFVINDLFEFKDSEDDEKQFVKDFFKRNKKK